MDLKTIGMDPGEAAAKLAEYKQVIQDGGGNAEDQALLAGYRAAARGLPMISLPLAVAAGGWHDNGLPRLAVVRATSTECEARWSGNDLVFTDEWSVDGNRGAIVGKHSVRVPIPGDALPAVDGWRWKRGVAMVPMIPPAHRPRWPRRLSSCHILWEVDEWSKRPPKDPALLSHVRGDLWTVLGTWLLTDLEQLVLSQRVTR